MNKVCNHCGLSGMPLKEYEGKMLCIQCINAKRRYKKQKMQNKLKAKELEIQQRQNEETK